MNELKKCPFCGCDASIRSTRSWHFLEAEHDDDCIFETGSVIQVPASDEQRELLVRDWNRRANSE
ncbi:Lar family restriction alleviation protein [Proteus hauseri]|uniref:Lar family restriction alleviation protein n=1 Tax=Proteus hauseri TaxID=183417 RepID=UPI0010097A4C|nr:Lar family restriction alleviation protein [Proteus hauseri]QAV22011.1 hypothetical protein PH4a_01020 [Proteus hauseri]QAV22351.1 hypothetical protein PH4a_02915 [Proteus hauseri]